jgi:drug/metabolite transporter (DMT)-like permease
MAHIRNIVRTDHGTNREAFGSVDWALFLGTALIFGSAFSMTAIALESLPPGVITVARGALGTATLAVISRRRIRIERSDWAGVVVLCIAWIVIPMSVVPIAQQWIDSGVAGLFAGAMPIAATTLAALLLRTAPRRAQVAGLVVGSAGVALISLPSLGEGSTAALGVGLMLLAVLCYALSVNIAVPLQHRYGSMALMTRILGLATVITSPLAIIEAGEAHPTARSLIALLALGTLGTAGAYALMGSLVGRVGSTRSSFVAYLVPVVALVLGVVVLGEELSWLTLSGAAFVTVGALLASSRGA